MATEMRRKGSQVKPEAPTIEKSSAPAITSPNEIKPSGTARADLFSVSQNAPTEEGAGPASSPEETRASEKPDHLAERPTTGLGGPFRLIVRQHEMHWDDGLGPDDPKPSTQEELWLWERRTALRDGLLKSKASLEKAIGKANRRANKERSQAENAERHLAAVLKRRYARAVRIITAACASRQLSPEKLEVIAEKIKSGEIS